MENLVENIKTIDRGQSLRYSKYCSALDTKRTLSFLMHLEALDRLIAFSKRRLISSE